ncbi:MAG: helix-turn-helix transcriptional regulator [Nitrospirales bacterium]
MPIGPSIRAWRLSRKYSGQALASQLGMPAASLEAIESGERDPPASVLESVASALGIPASWLYADPGHLDRLTMDSDGDTLISPSKDSPDPVIDCILSGAQDHRELFVLLTTIIQGGEPKLLRAVEASLRSLAKQSRQATVPWQNRPPGHFEPPSD